MLAWLLYVRAATPAQRQTGRHNGDAAHVHRPDIYHGANLYGIGTQPFSVWITLSAGGIFLVLYGVNRSGRGSRSPP